jgi:uncharacterized damage-inducible protein DinB
MPIVDALLPEFDHEMATTRKVLERVPEDKLDWKPHAKSWSMGGLATHVANLPSWGSIALNQDSFDLATGGTAPQAASRVDLLAAFDRNVASTRATLTGKTDPEMMAPWTLEKEGHTLFTMPKIAVMRSFVLNHIIHHRGQLSVYLRLTDVPVPSIYGPSADEQPF